MILSQSSITAFAIMGILLTQTLHAQTSSPYVVSGPTTGGGATPLTLSGSGNIVTTLPGIYNPATPLLSPGTKTNLTISSGTAITVNTNVTDYPAIEMDSGVVHIYGSIATTGATPESALVTGNATVINYGTISGGASGVVITGGRVNNYGSITGVTQYGVIGVPTVNNYGTISSDAAFAAVSAKATYNSFSGTANTAGATNAVMFTTANNNTAMLSGITRFNGATGADINGGGGTGNTIVLNFIGGTTTAYAPGGGTGSITIGGYTYTFTGFNTVTNNSRSLASLGATANEQLVGNGLDNAINWANSANVHPADLATLDNTLTALYFANPGEVSTALSQLSPEKFAVFNSETAFNNASFETQAMDSYLASLRGADGNFLASSGDINTSGLALNDPNYDSSLASVRSRLLAWNPGTASDGLLNDSANSMLAGIDMKDTKSMAAPAYDNPWNFFVRGNVILAQGASQTDVPYFSDNTESVVLGTDYRINRNFLVGVSAGYAHTNATLDHDGSTTAVDSYSPGIYASYADHGWYSNFSGQYVYNSYSQSRSIAFLGQMAQSSPNGNEGVVNLDGGYDFHHGAMTFGPIAGLQYTHLTVNSYSESGSIADLNMDEDDSNSLRSRLGGTFRYAFKSHGTIITPHIDASWQHEFLDQSRGVNSQFGFGGGSFAVNTPNPSRDSALVDAGINADLNRTVSVFADYIVQAGQDNYFGQSVQAGVKIGF